MIKDYYKILNIARQADITEIKKAFRALALQWHPDRNKAPTANEIFIQINEAYEILSDESKRKIYDSLYDEYFISKNIIASQSQQQNDYEKYSQWVTEAVNVAYERSKMTFNEFSIFANSIFKGIVWGCGTIAGIVLWFFWGPFSIYFIIENLPNIIRGIEEDGFTYRPFVLILIFIFCCSITVGGLIAGLKTLKEN